MSWNLPMPYSVWTTRSPFSMSRMSVCARARRWCSRWVFLRLLELGVWYLPKSSAEEITASLTDGMVKPCASSPMDVWMPFKMVSPMSSVKRCFSPLLEKMRWIFQSSVFHSASCLLKAWRLFCWSMKSPASKAPRGDGWMGISASGSDVSVRTFTPSG